MKAFKVLQVYKNRYFSYNPTLQDVTLYARKQRTLSVDASYIIEYKLNTWNVAKRNASPNLFIFNDINDAEKFISTTSWVVNIQLWLVEVDDIQMTPPAYKDAYPKGTCFCKKLKLLSQIPL